MGTVIAVALLVGGFVLSFFTPKWLKKRYGPLLLGVLCVFFLVQAFIDAERVYFSLFVVLIAFAILLKSLKDSGSLQRLRVPKATKKT